MRKSILILTATLLSIPVFAQERTDSLSATTFVGRQAGNYISKGKDIRTEVVSSAGLQKMACCSLADSFENSASVNVGYSDATTGARQIRLLGLSGTYTQMLDETRPVMRGLFAPFGLSYVPSPWLESIQIAKGAASVVNGPEAITGSINMEHKKPTDEKPLFINASYMSDSKTDLNAVSSLQMGEHWSTALFGHVSGNFKTMDMNGDGFVDDPKQHLVSIGNRWLYYSPDIQIRFGINAIKDKRQGGQLDMPDYGWTSNIDNSSLSAYLKVGKPIGESGSIAMIADYGIQKMDSDFGHGITAYDASQNTAHISLLYQNSFGDMHSVTAGLSGFGDWYDEDFKRKSMFMDGQYLTHWNGKTSLASAGPYAEYTFRAGDKFTAIAGARADWYTGNGIKLVPRMNIKYAPSEALVIRANAGRGIRFSNPLIDNIGVFSTNKMLVGSMMDHMLEDAWIYGGNATLYFGSSDKNYFSVDYFHTEFNDQMIVDYEPDLNIAGAAFGAIDFYSLSSIHGFSHTDTYQADLSLEPLERFTVTTTFRYTKAMTSFKSLGLVEKPMTSRFKGVLNLQYALPMNKWIFDFTASLNGPSKLYSFMYDKTKSNGYSPVYPLLYAQVTKRMKGFDIYIGGENLTGFTQNQILFSAPKYQNFDASCIWGPVMPAKFYAGVRITIWKTE